MVTSLHSHGFKVLLRHRGIDTEQDEDVLPKQSGIVHTISGEFKKRKREPEQKDTSQRVLKGARQALVGLLDKRSKKSKNRHKQERMNVLLISLVKSPAF